MLQKLAIAAVGLSATSLAAYAAEGPLVGPGVTGQKMANGETIGADVGAGPHIEHRTSPAPRLEDAVDQVPPADRPAGNASTGSSRAPDATQGSSGADNDAIEADEARAAKNKEKFKQRPGYRVDPPQPRAEATQK